MRIFVMELIEKHRKKIDKKMIDDLRDRLCKDEELYLTTIARENASQKAQAGFTIAEVLHGMD